jgi:rubrerythrin
MVNVSKTLDDLKAGFAGESQANRRYLFFAEKADKEGFAQIARLFRAVATAETVHARKHFDVMAGAGATKDNLAAAIAGEHYEFSEMYPSFIKDAQKEENMKAEVDFSRSGDVEKVHHQLFEAAIKALDAKQEVPNEPYFVCGVCGYTVAGEAPDKCPVCGALKILFQRVD